MGAADEAAAAAQLRRDIVAEMGQQKETLQWFVDEPWGDYIRRMSLPGTWGGALLSPPAVLFVLGSLHLQALSTRYMG